MNSICSAFRQLGCIWCWKPSRSSGYDADQRFLFRRMAVFWVMGPPKCGKAEVAQLLAKTYKYRLLKVDELLRKPDHKEWRAKIVKSYLARRANVIQEIVIDVLKDAIIDTRPKTTGYVIEGFPLYVKDAIRFEHEICHVSKVIYVTVELNEFLAKLPRDSSPEEIDAARNKFVEHTKNLDAIFEMYKGRAVKIFFTDALEDSVVDLEDFYDMFTVVGKMADVVTIRRRRNH